MVQLLFIWCALAPLLQQILSQNLLNFYRRRRAWHWKRMPSFCDVIALSKRTLYLSMYRTVGYSTEIVSSSTLLSTQFTEYSFNSSTLSNTGHHCQHKQLKHCCYYCWSYWYGTIPPPDAELFALLVSKNNATNATKQDFMMGESKTSKVEEEVENGVAELPEKDMNRISRQHQNWLLPWI